MANIKSQIKRNKQNDKNRLRNRFVRGNARKAISKALKAIDSHEQLESREAVLQAVSALDRAASKGVIHKNNAARHKSSLMKRLNKLEA